MTTDLAQTLGNLIDKQSAAYVARIMKNISYFDIFLARVLTLADAEVNVFPKL
jgi:hypothetical protein